ncbi:MAG TPA: LysM peptidoglycan-binding domain-containing protein [Steroidobacteraceae bacterium]|jgi:LysM repeat protein|nr:LysM peptidoglycan-binding domain-containing protein [Steroidobacteraceae bacterium]
MVSIQLSQARALAGLIAVSVVLTGCGMFGHGRDTSSPAPMRATPVSSDTTQAAPEEDLTATEAAIETAPAQASPGPDASIIRPDAPKTYTVKPGDTLWGVASMFLKDAYLWPEVWIINPQVKNPHLIYPGDTLALAYGANGRPQITLQSGGAARLNPRLRSSELEGAIPTIPYSSIAAFLSKPSVLTKEQIRNAPHVLAFREKHMVGGAGNEIYVKDLKAPVNSRFSVVHVGDPLIDPDNGDVVGYEGIYTASAAVVKADTISKAVLSDSARETLAGDKLIAVDNETPLNFVLSTPPPNLEGRIIAVVDGTYLIGQYQVVVINRGARHGVVPGNVMAVDQAGELVSERKSGYMTNPFAKKIQLPSERAGTMLVFKTFDRISYGLIVGASSEIHVADYVRNP